MKVAHITCSVKDLNHDYEHLQWIRLFLLSNGINLSEDWINHSLIIRNNKLRFRPAPNFDYMRIATESIHQCDLGIFLMIEPSTFTLTMLRYSLHTNKKTILIRGRKPIEALIGSYDKKDLFVLTLSNYRHKLKELL